MYAIKRELKLNNREVSLMRGMAGFRRFVYNYCLDLLIASWDFENIKASDSQRIAAIKKIFTQVTMQKTENSSRGGKYPGTPTRLAETLKRQKDKCLKCRVGRATFRLRSAEKSIFILRDNVVG